MSERIPVLMFCGLDEAGRGPMVGPLVVGAVWYADESVPRELGAKDSKKLTPAQRERLYDRIAETADHWVVVPISAADLDEAMTRNNLNEVEMQLFARAASSFSCDIVQVDCPEVNTERFGNILSQMIGGTRVDARNKADVVFPTVSAASIMAKVTRDRMIEDIKKELGIDVGSGYPSDPTTKAFVENWINEYHTVPPHTRRSWKPVKDLMSKKAATTLDDW